MRLRLKTILEASVQIINQASVPQGLSSHLTEASEKQKRRTKLQLVTDEAEIKTKDLTKMSSRTIFFFSRKKHEAAIKKNYVEESVRIINAASVPPRFVITSNYSFKEAKTPIQIKIIQR